MFILSGQVVINPIFIAQYAAALITVIFFGYYIAIFFFMDMDLNERKSLIALFVICVASTLFWAGFEQAGSSLNLFGRDFTNRLIGTFEIPTSWFQSANSFFIVILSPFFAALWVNLGKKLIRPNYGLKCAAGLIIMSSGFIVMFFASQAATSGLTVAPYWLITTYFLHTVGELCLSPVALTAVSKLSPKRLAGQMMGIFTLTYSIGSLVAGLIAGKFDPESINQMPNLYLQISLFSIFSGIVIAIFATRTKDWESLLQESSTLLETKR
jgi:POT family proton-dependent oligopeptide transporter